MKRNEAVEWLKSIKEKYIRGGDDFYDCQRRTAIDYAVSVLEQKPQTNADRIRAMSDEELAAVAAGIMMLSGGAVAHYFGVAFDEDELNEYIKDLAREFAKELKKPIEN